MEQALITNWFLNAEQCGYLEFHIEYLQGAYSIHPSACCPLLIESEQDNEESLYGRIELSENDRDVCGFLGALSSVSKCSSELAGVVSAILGMGFMVGQSGLACFGCNNKYSVRHAADDSIEWKNLLYETPLGHAQNLLLLVVQNQKQKGLILVTNRASLCITAADYFGSIVSAVKIPMQLQSKKFRFGVGLLGNEHLNHYSSNIERFVFQTIPTAGYMLGIDVRVVVDDEPNNQRAVLVI